jgi:hypothetical protein
MTSELIIHLEVPVDREIPRCEMASEYDGEFDNILSVLTDLCEVLARADNVRFVIGGFGQDNWGARVDRELCMLLEQLPGVAGSLARDDPAFALEFLEQGFWRTLSFETDQAHFVVSCTSGDAWRPSPEQVRVSRSNLTSMLALLVETFCDAASIACPELVEHPWFTEWRESVSTLDDSAR